MTLTMVFTYQLHDPPCTCKSNGLHMQGQNKCKSCDLQKQVTGSWHAGCMTPHVPGVSNSQDLLCQPSNKCDRAVHRGKARDGDGGWLVDRLPLMDLNGHARVIVCGKGHRPLHSQIISTTLLAMLKVIGELHRPFSDGVSYTPPLQKAKKQGEMTIPSHPHSHPISKFYFSWMGWDTRSCDREEGGTLDHVTGGGKDTRSCDREWGRDTRQGRGTWGGKYWYFHSTFYPSILTEVTLRPDPMLTYITAMQTSEQWSVVCCASVNSMQSGRLKKELLCAVYVNAMEDFAKPLHRELPDSHGHNEGAGPTSKVNKTTKP